LLKKTAEMYSSFHQTIDLIIYRFICLFNIYVEVPVLVFRLRGLNFADQYIIEKERKGKILERRSSKNYGTVANDFWEELTKDLGIIK
jgi:hypothetical protein